MSTEDTTTTEPEETTTTTVPVEQPGDEGDDVVTRDTIGTIDGPAVAGEPAVRITTPKEVCVLKDGTKLDDFVYADDWSQGSTQLHFDPCAPIPTTTPVTVDVASFPATELPATGTEMMLAPIAALLIAVGFGVRRLVR